MEVRNSVVVVTGAARGIGRAIAEAFARAGAAVALADVLGDQLAETVAQLGHAGGRVLGVATDTTDVGQVEDLAGRVEAELGPADVLVNNAGTFSVIAPVWEADPERWFRDVRVNLYGSFLCARAFVGGMVSRGRGYVINIISSGGVGDPHPYCTSYASSKAGLMRLTEGLAAEVREHGVKVFALAPPAVLTEMTRFIMEDPGGRHWRPGFGRIFEEGRGTRPEAIAERVLELVSGSADALTGRYVPAAGDLAELVRQADDILAHDRLTLRIRQ
jgi:NAD(P)-dependent dehydrogenase (short-subunit alcohol dehydrogenase family)